MAITQGWIQNLYPSLIIFIELPGRQPVHLYRLFFGKGLPLQVRADSASESVGSGIITTADGSHFSAADRKPHEQLPFFLRSAGEVPRLSHSVPPVLPGWLRGSPH